MPEAELKNDNYLHKNSNNVCDCLTHATSVQPLSQGLRSSSTAGSGLKTSMQLQGLWLNIVFDYDSWRLY